MEKLKTWVLVLSFLSAFPSFAGNIKLNKISDNLHILSGKDYGTNIGLISLKQGIVLIDPMPGDNHLPELNQKIQSLYGSTNVFVLNTHTHADHSGGNEFFVKQGGKHVNGEFNVKGLTRIQVKSHSSTDFIYYHEESNAIFVGDVLDTSWHPTFYAGGVKGFNNAVSAILKLGDDNSLIIPGHGTLATKAELNEFRKNTLAWVRLIKHAHQNGKNVNHMMNDAQVKDMVERFNVGGQPTFLPQKAFKRFIERTITVIKKEENI